MKFLSTLALMLAILLVPACFPTKNVTQVNKTVAVPEVQYVEASLIEGKTTKQEILDALGTPDSFSEGSFRYRYRHGKDQKAKLAITHKDGTTMNVVLGQDEKFTNLTIGFSYKNRKLLDSVSVY